MNKMLRASVIIMGLTLVTVFAAPHPKLLSFLTSQAATLSVEEYKSLAHTIDPSRDHDVQAINQRIQSLIDNAGANVDSRVLTKLDDSFQIIDLGNYAQFEKDQNTLRSGFQGSMPPNFVATGDNIYDAVTTATNATSNNTPKTVVMRDATGGFSAGIITAATGLNLSAGSFSAGGGKFTVAAATGDTSITGTLAVTGNTTHTGSISTAGGLTVSANGANITGNSMIAGTLDVRGPLWNSLNSVFTINDDLVITGTSGLMLKAGSVKANKIAPYSGSNVTINSDLTLTGSLSIASGALNLSITGTSNSAVYFGGYNRNMIKTTATASSIVARDGNADISARKLLVSADLKLTGTGSSVVLNNQRMLHTIGDPNSTNLFVGSQAGNFGHSGSKNNALGYKALNRMTGGYQNIAIGNLSMSTLVTGSNHIALGTGALSTVTTGTQNIGIGTGAGSKLKTGSYNIYLDNPGIANESGTLRLGTTSTHTACFIQGIRGASISNGLTVFVDPVGRLGVTLSSKEFKRDIKDLAPDFSAQLMKLRPVSFKYKEHNNEDLHFGLIAEEVEKVMPEMVIMRDDKPYSVAYHMLPPLLLQQYQQQQKLLNDYAEKLESHEQEIVKLKAMLSNQT